MIAQKLRNLWSRLTGRAVIPPNVTMGLGVHVGDGVRIDWSHSHHITIEDDVTIVSGARILAHDASSYRRTGLTWVSPVVLKRGCFVGADAIIMPGVTVGEGAVVAAGAVVTHNVAPGEIVAGVPARSIGSVERLDVDRLTAAATRPVLPESVYNAHPLSPELIARMRSAAHDGGYFLARVPGAKDASAVSVADAVPPLPSPSRRDERADTT